MVVKHALWAPVIRVVKLIALYFGYQLALFAVLAGIHKLLVGCNLLEESSQHGMVVLSVSLLLSEVLVICHLLHFKYVSRQSMAWSAIRSGVLCVSVLMVFGIMNVSNILLEFLDLPNLMQDQFVEVSRNVFGFVAIAILGPIAEELTFRVGMEGYFLRHGFSPRKAILVSAAIFGVVHVNPIQVAYAFCLGVVFGWLYYRTRSALPTIIGHILNNCMAALIMVFGSDEMLDKTTVELFGLGHTILILVAATVLVVLTYGALNKKLLPKGSVRLLDDDSVESDDSGEHVG
ncbi:MAG: CPBP family intramembrane metalloprotease [Bacteroidales bacterium]|nr:CPBP family intramembrane metalloprotease [Bacteroidales bacterium]